MKIPALSPTIPKIPYSIGVPLKGITNNLTERILLTGIGIFDSSLPMQFFMIDHKLIG